MSSPSPSPRQERFEKLCSEINYLVERYPTLPPGRLAEVCQEEINKKMREIDALNAEAYAEEVGDRKETGVSSGPNYPGLGVSLLVILVGLVVDSSLLILTGGIGVLVCLSVFARQMAVPEAEPERERFKWQP